MSQVNLKPNMFCDVMRLTPRQAEAEITAKENVFAMAGDTSDEPDMTALMEDTQSTINSTMSEDSLMRHSIASTASSKCSLDRPSVDAVFKQLSEEEERVRESTSVSVTNQGPIRFSVWVSFLEIYNELVYDLLVPIPKKKNARRNVLHLREDKNGSPYVRGD